MKWLACDDGTPSTAKLWRHIAFAVITYRVAIMEGLTYDIILVYLGAVAGVEIGQKFTPAAKAKVAVQSAIAMQGINDNDQQSEGIRSTSRSTDPR